MMNTIENCNNDLLEQQKQDWKNTILYNKNSNGFIVFDIEAGCRKTRTAEEALAEMAIKCEKQAIFVRLNNKDCRESVDNINRLAGAEVALAFNNEALPTQEERIRKSKLLNQFPILVITHAKYLALAKNTSAQNLFTKGRSTLVIDEFVSVRETICITPSILNSIKLLLIEDVPIYQKFNELVAPLENKLISSQSSNERNFVRIENGFVTKEFDNLIRLIKNNINSNKLQCRKDIITKSDIEGISTDFLSDKINSVKSLCEWIWNIKEFCINVCILSHGRAYVNNTRIKHWLLDNSIILDANGELQAAYSLNPELYHLKECESVLSHKNWTVVNVPINTTTAGKEHLTQYYKFIKRRLEQYKQDILVVCQKKEEPILSEHFDHTAYFGNLIGSNEWVDIKNVAIVHTPNLNDFEYILTYLFYNKKHIETNITTSARRRGCQMCTQYKFDDRRFEEIRSRWIATEVYQAVKRVNRNMIYKTDCIIFINNDDVIKLLSEKLKHCTVESETVTVSDVGYSYTQRDKYIDSLKENSYANKFIRLLAELQEGKHKDLSCGNGKYKKKVIREYLGIESAVCFNRYALNKSNVIEYCQTRHIDLSGQTIKLLQ